MPSIRSFDVRNREDRRTMDRAANRGALDEDGIYFRAAEGTYAIPPELKSIRKTRTSSNLSWISNPENVNLNLNNWQSDPSRVVYHGGKYHMWMIDLDRAKCAEAHYWANPDFFKTPEGRDFRPDSSRDPVSDLGGYAPVDDTWPSPPWSGRLVLRPPARPYPKSY